MSAILKDRSNEAKSTKTKTKKTKKIVLEPLKGKQNLLAGDVTDMLSLLQPRESISCLKRIQHQDGSVNNKHPSKGSYTNYTFIKHGHPVLSLTTDSLYLDKANTPHEVNISTDSPLFNVDESFTAQQRIHEHKSLNSQFANKLGTYLTQQEQLARAQTVHNLLDCLDSNKAERTVDHTNWNPLTVPLFPIERDQIICANCEVSHDNFIKQHPAKSFDKPAWRVCKAIAGDPHSTAHKQIVYCPICIDDTNHNQNATPHNNNILPIIWAPARFLRDNYQPMFIGGNASNPKYYTGNDSSSHWLDHIPSQEDSQHSPTTNFWRGYHLRNDSTTNAIIRKGRC